MMNKKRGCGAAIKGCGAVMSMSTEQAKKPEKVDVNFDKQKYEGTVDVPKDKKAISMTSTKVKM
jgi:hypothetical protein